MTKPRTSLFHRTGLVLISSALPLAILPVSANAAPRTRAAVETIVYETSPCFGACPVYRLSVSTNGRGTFEGRRFTRQSGPRTFSVTPAAFAEFRRRLTSVRPVGEVLMTGPEACKSFATDMPTIDVTWSGGGRKPAHLAYNLGCNRETHRWMIDHLRKAVDALPVARFIAPVPGRPVH